MRIAVSLIETAVNCTAAFTS